MFTSSLKRTVCVTIIALAAAGCQSRTPKTEKAAAHSSLFIHQTAQYVKGRNLYGLRCGTCHRLHSVTEYKLDAWKPILDSMAPMANLSDDQKAAVFAYISGASQAKAQPH